MKRMFVLTALAALATPVQAQSFTVLGHRFGADALVAADGRLLVAPNGERMVRLAADRWMRAQGDATPQQWYDDAGRLLREDRGYTEYHTPFVLPQAAPGDRYGRRSSAPTASRRAVGAWWMHSGRCACRR